MTDTSFNFVALKADKADGVRQHVAYVPCVALLWYDCFRVFIPAGRSI